MNNRQSRFDRIHPLLLFFAIFATAIAVRFVLFIVLDRSQVMLRSELERIALSLLRDGSFADPYAIPTGPTAHAAPVYPWLMSMVYGWFGGRIEGEWAQQALRVLWCATAFGLLPFVSATLFGSRRPGAIAALLGVFSPAYFLTETQGKEATFAALLLLLAVWAWFPVLQDRAWTGKNAAGIGILWGLLLLAYPGMLPVYCILMAWSVLVLNHHGKFLVIVTCFSALLLAPWVIRNYQRLDSWMFVRDNFGLELDFSNGDQATPDLDSNLQRAKQHPVFNLEQALKVREMGEPAYHRMRLHNAIVWIQNHPGDFLELTIQRIVSYWFAPQQKLYRALPKALATILMLAGLALLWNRHPAGGVLLSIVAISYSLPYYIIQTSDRYRYPAEWAVLLSAGFAVGWCLEQVQGAVRSVRQIQHVSVRKPSASASDLPAGSARAGKRPLPEPAGLAQRASSP